jgi:hypothetical protein
MPKILAPSPLNSAQSMNTSRKHTHLMPIAVQTTRRRETQSTVQNSVFSVISDVLVQTSVEEISHDKFKTTN